MKKFLKAIPVFFSKHETLDNVNQYDIGYLYHLLTKDDTVTYVRYIKHMPIVNRIIVISTLILLVFGTLIAMSVYENKALSLSVLSLTVTLTITVNRIIEYGYRENIKSQIEYRKYLNEQTNSK